MEIPKDIETYTFAPGTKEIRGIACRKHKALKSVSLPDGLKVIGDAAFSFCTKLKKVTIPASVEHIGVASFCGSGIEVATFLGVPKDIEPSVFAGCNRLARIVVPQGSKSYFTESLDHTLTSLIIEAESKPNTATIETQYSPQPGHVVRQLDMFGGGQTFVEQPNMFSQLQTDKPAKPARNDTESTANTVDKSAVKRCTITYNFHNFSWTKGDKVNLEELFCAPTTLIGDPSYQFRRKVLFVFLKSETINQLQLNGSEYDLPAKMPFFVRKYEEKYSQRIPRIILFVCDDGKKAKFYDEVKYVKANKNSITVKSLLRP